MKEQSVVPLSADEEASFAASFAQAERGEFASDEQVRAVWAKHGLRSFDTHTALDGLINNNPVMTGLVPVIYAGKSRKRSI
ncbi:hypothetical protein [Methylocystis heyeri]|uniref:Uncharacterized protein n=1 Tax=Methylocystis heyeri TaxID=391905 RepID=A0A6B8KDA2_9HYPH|nr:hypothetical protein [Methylocystis heyeri]QGM45667.1 hypothetical protein H2LOC_008115 [Methylocystis heyeri]